MVAMNHILQVLDLLLRFLRLAQPSFVAGAVIFRQGFGLVVLAASAAATNAGGAATTAAGYAAV